MDINTERIALNLPEKELPVKTKDKISLVRSSVFIFSLLLIMVSLAVHIGIIAVACDFVSDGETFQSLMLSAVLPPFTKQEAFSEEEKTEIHKNMHPETEATAETVTEPEIIKNSVSMNLAAGGEFGFSLKNETTYNPDLEVLFNSPNPIDKADKLYEKYTEGEPLVLIYHTHGTESYNDTNDTGTYRSVNPERNMIAVGTALANAIEANGIKVIHLTEMFDEESYNNAYNKSHSAVEKLMDEYPSIQYVLDIHRDSIVDESGNCISADFTYNGATAAQLMFVVGTDEGGSEHTEWRTNLTAVLHLQEMLTASAPFSVRPINLRKASFYQDESAGAMLVEIGTCGNTLNEAKRSAVVFGHTLSKYITGKEPSSSLSELLESLV